MAHKTWGLGFGSCKKSCEERDTDGAHIKHQVERVRVRVPFKLSWQNEGDRSIDYLSTSSCPLVAVSRPTRFGVGVEMLRLPIIDKSYIHTSRTRAETNQSWGWHATPMPMPGAAFICVFVCFGLFWFLRRSVCTGMHRRHRLRHRSRGRGRLPVVVQKPTGGWVVEVAVGLLTMRRTTPDIGAHPSRGGRGKFPLSHLISASLVFFVGATKKSRALSCFPAWTDRDVSHLIGRR